MNTYRSYACAALRNREVQTFSKDSTFESCKCGPSEQATQHTQPSTGRTFSAERSDGSFAPASAASSPDRFGMFSLLLHEALEACRKHYDFTSLAQRPGDVYDV